MAHQTNNGGDKKPHLKIQDLQTKKDPQGGVRKAGKGQQSIKINDPGFK
jgi:hypothetical protein